MEKTIDTWKKSYISQLISQNKYKELKVIFTNPVTGLS